MNNDIDIKFDIVWSAERKKERRRIRIIIIIIRNGAKTIKLNNNSAMVHQKQIQGRGPGPPF
jgi:hypothetical protein